MTIKLVTPFIIFFYLCYTAVFGLPNTFLDYITNLTAMLVFVLIFLISQLVESVVESNITDYSTKLSEQASEKCAKEAGKNSFGQQVYFQVPD
jgi:hypothetical protein